MDGQVNKTHNLGIFNLQLSLFDATTLEINGILGWFSTIAECIISLPTYTQSAFLLITKFHVK